MFDTIDGWEQHLTQATALIARVTASMPPTIRALEDGVVWESSQAHVGDLEEASLVADIECLGPGILLAAALSNVDVDALSGHDRVAVMVAHQRMASYHQAQLYASMASVADAVAATLQEEDNDYELIEEACASEIRAALHLTRRAADTELAVARSFQSRLPEVWQALAAGHLDRRRANLIVHQTSHLAASLARRVACEALKRAPKLTTGELTAHLKRLCIETDPDDAQMRYRSAVEERRVVVEAGIDGTAHLHLLDLPPDRAMRIRDRIDSMARSLRTRGEVRTIDQLRADVALDLLDPKDGAGRHHRGAMIMTVDLATLAGLADSSADLGGFGPVIADIARQVARTSAPEVWRFVVADDHGRPVNVGTTSRRPSHNHRRLLEAAFPTCVFPGCRIPAARCDLDHRTPWTHGGSTTAENLAPLCRHDHRLRHLAGWRYQSTPTGGHEWQSPLGNKYTTNPRAP